MCIRDRILTDDKYAVNSAMALIFSFGFAVASLNTGAMQSSPFNLKNLSEISLWFLIRLDRA